MIRRIPPVFKERPWGAEDVGPWFPPRGVRTGEVWFQTEPPLPLLAKFIFTSERLSVQVHPNDAEARERGLENGKTEMWHVLRAKPGATLALGFRMAIDAGQARAAALSGAIVDLLDWAPARAGDTFFVPAGTVHAIGAGLAICEIQQNSDTTFRLFDYGRGRPLHLEDGLAVARLTPREPQPQPRLAAAPWTQVARCEYFVTEIAELETAWMHPASEDEFKLLVVLEGSGRIDGQQYRAGECWLAGPGTEGFAVDPETPTRMLRSGPPRGLVS
ncbi:MAG: class I mannose-6-phosphate isomerase [Candidatus Solibacter usitatus]|nr:class I mannose-6-phosphate isomerase [Candidatus Solibacter usitatus]